MVSILTLKLLFGNVPQSVSIVDISESSFACKTPQFDHCPGNISMKRGGGGG